VVIASGGYPGSYETGKPIDGLNGEGVSNTEIFQAGTRRTSNGEIVTAGGRVLTVVGTGKDLAVARSRAYERLEHVGFTGMQYRTDIAQRELAPDRAG
jgi:phosphoribosylamine--glycine ligase